MDSPLIQAVDDEELDDAALWAVIDSAAAASTSYSSAAVMLKHTKRPSETPPSQRTSSPDMRNLEVVSYRSPSTSDVSCEKLDRHCLTAQLPSVSLFKEYQNAAMAILEKSDYTMISGNTYIKKSGWRKISFYFNLSYEIKDKIIEFDENHNVQRAEFIVRAYMHGGRFSDGWGSCERREKKFMKPNHDIPCTAETRAKNRACQDSCFSPSSSEAAMAQQEEGWPLGLQPMNVRAGIVSRNRELSLSHSFNTFLSASSISSLDSSSDLDTESSDSFFHEKSTSLGSLIGASSSSSSSSGVLKLSRRSTTATESKRGNKRRKNYKTKIWFFSLCPPELSTDAVSTDTNNNAPSLGHFLEAERRVRRRNTGPPPIVDDFYQVSSPPNPLFVGGRIAPPHTNP
ncbi:hypothetical protein M569_07609, partial [Genlisea aurea]